MLLDFEIIAKKSAIEIHHYGRLNLIEGKKTTNSKQNARSKISFECMYNSAFYQLGH